MVKKILSILAWVVTAAGIVVLFIFARKNYLDTPIKFSEPNIERKSDTGFISRAATLNEISEICGKTNVASIDMPKILKTLDNNPWIESRNTYVDLDGNLNINIKEYEPMLRVFSWQGQSIYLTENGMVLPSSKQYRPYLLIASGNFSFDEIKDTYRLSDTTDLDCILHKSLHIAKAIQENEFTKNAVSQLYYNQKGEFELVVKGVDAKIVVGDTCQIDDKLKRLEIFTKKKYDTHEIMEFKTINLKYKNQIVCTKNIKR